MKPRSLKVHLFISFLLIIAFIGVALTFFGFYVVKFQIINRAQQQVKLNLKTADYYYNNELSRLKKLFLYAQDISDIPAEEDLKWVDYMRVVTKEDIDKVKSEIVQRAFTGVSIGGSRIIDKDELIALGSDLYEKHLIHIRPTAHAKPSSEEVLESVIALEYAVPFFEDDRDVDSVLYAGRILNQDYDFVDSIRDIVFEKSYYEGQLLGTVTIFQGDIRVATNVIDDSGQRAIGTRISEEVFTAVLEEGRRWFDRAFVVKDWYLTAYQPIRSINGEIIGSLYVGVLEKPFMKMQSKFLISFALILLVAGVVAASIAYFLATLITEKGREVLRGIEKISRGNFMYRAPIDTPVEELNTLAASYNSMAEALLERDDAIKATHNQLQELNAHYLDLIGFVSHELKGVIGTAVMGATSLREGTFGDVTVQQKEVLTQIVRNMDYLTMTIRSFLNLSMIEKNELAIHPSEFYLKRDVIDEALRTFMPNIENKGMSLKIDVSESIQLYADYNLMQIVAHNLFANAVKYGKSGGCLSLSAAIDDNNDLRVDFYNEGEPIVAYDASKLFKRFSRITNVETVKIKGTGLGLFITKTIVEKHGGRIWHEAKANGNIFSFLIPAEYKGFS